MFGDTFKNFSINFNAANETGHFSSGDLLSGRVFFQLTKESKITSITMDVEGKAHIHWSTSGGGKKRRRRHFSAKLEFFKIKILFLQESPVGGTTTLQAGTHEYPFSCQLPHGDFPSSFCGVNGQITYTVKVGIKRPWHLTKDFVSEFKFMSHLDTNQPELRSPLSGTNTTTPGCLWCAAGPITMTASSEKKAFIPGETVKIICKFSNASSRTVTPKLRLKQKQGFYTLRKENQRVVFKYLAALTGNPISAHTSGVHTEFSLTVPSTAPLTISNCSILEVEYVIEVKLSIPFSYSLEVLIPIILCGTRVDIDPPPYITE